MIAAGRRLSDLWRRRPARRVIAGRTGPREQRSAAKGQAECKWCCAPARFFQRAGRNSAGSAKQSPPGDRRANCSVRPFPANTERVATGGNGGGRQNIKPPPRKPGAPQPLCKPLCGAPRRGGTCRLAVRRKRPGGGMGRAREGEGNHRCPSPSRRTP